MHYVSINTTTMSVIVAAFTIEQAHAHSDIKCKRENFIIVDPTCYGWWQFNQPSRRLLLANLTDKDVAPDKEVTEHDLNVQLQRLEVDKTPLEELNAKRPHIPVIHAEGVKVNTQRRGRTSPTPAPVKREKGPSAKTVVYGLMDTKYAANPGGDIPALRIELMNEMGDSHPHIKRTTISTTLGQWAKENA